MSDGDSCIFIMKKDACLISSQSSLRVRHILSAFHVVGCGFVPRPGHTKDHHNKYSSTLHYVSLLGTPVLGSEA